MDESGSEQIEELTLEPVAVVRSRRPRTLWGVLALMGVAAAAFVVTSAGDDGAQRPGLPVSFGSAASPRAAGAAEDSMMPAWVIYVPSDDLPALGGEAPAYRLSGIVSEDAVRTLADALGLEGEVQSDGGGTWWMDGGGAGRLDVFSGSGASWSFYAGARDCVTENGSIGGCTSPGEPGVAVAPSSSGGPVCADGVECVEPTTTTYGPAPCVGTDPANACDPADIECRDGQLCEASPPERDAECAVAKDPACPDVTTAIDLAGEDEARAIALAVVAASGADVDGARVTAQAGGESRSWYLTVEPVVDGHPSGLLAAVEVSDAGVVLSGNGYLGTPERLGDYPLLDTRAVIDRANAQQPDRTGIEPAVLGDVEATDAGGTTGGAPSVGAAASGDPCAPPDGASDGCGGTTGPDACEACDPIDAPVTTVVDCAPDGSDCGTTGGSAGEPPTPTEPPPCKVQADGSEICETEPGVICPQLGAPEDLPLGAPEAIECTPPVPDPGVVPEPLPGGPIEIVLVDAESSLVLLGANDGSTDAYLVPGYRFTDADGGQVDLPAVADDELTGPPSPDTTVPDSIVPDPGGKPVPNPEPCGDPLMVEDDTSTTHTVQPNPDCVEPDPAGEDPEIGVAHPVEVLGHCANIVDFDGRWWSTVEFESAGLPIDSGTLTLTDADHGTLEGEGLSVEMMASGPTEEYPGCD